MTPCEIQREPTDRPLRYRARRDLAIERQTYRGRSCWVVKDPVRLKYFRFDDQEHALLTLLDAKASPAELHAALQSRFGRDAASSDEIVACVRSLHAQGLLLAEFPVRQTPPAEPARRFSPSNLLAIRLPGFEPRRLLHLLDPALGWLFTRRALPVAALWIVAAVVLLLVQFDVFLSRLPAFQDFFGPGSWWTLALVLAATKMLHELGHALAARRCGVTCREIGFMLFLFMPCLYCNVSDAWMLSSKWRRIAIAAAGMYVELLLAATATFVWWFSEPGLVSHVALQVMLISSVSTLLINANPLLRYDGYYMLSDWIEMPNLRERARGALRGLSARWMFGLCGTGAEKGSSGTGEQRRGGAGERTARGAYWLAGYALLAVVYRWVIVLSILWLLHGALKPYGLEAVVLFLGVLLAQRMILGPLGHLIRFIRRPETMERVSRRRALIAGSLCLALLGAILFVPLPRRARCPAYVQFADATPLYVETAGQLTQVGARVGDSVRRGAPIASLANLPLEYELASLIAQRDRYQARLAALREQRFDSDEAAEALASTAETLRSLEEQVAKKQAEQQHLALLAPVDGVVLPGEVRQRVEDVENVLSPWWGGPLEVRNVGATLSQGTLACRIGDPTRVEAVLAIDQAEIGRVQHGQTVEICFDARPTQTLRGRIVEIGQRGARDIPEFLSASKGGDIPARQDAAGSHRPWSTTYFARVELENAEAPVPESLSGAAKILVGSESIASRGMRFLARTLRFSL